MAECWSYLLICFVGMVCRSDCQIILDDTGLLIRLSGVLAFVVSFDFVSDFEVFLQLLKLVYSKIELRFELVEDT